mgnify:CR=1 FL=1
MLPSNNMQQSSNLLVEKYHALNDHLSQQQQYYSTNITPKLDSLRKTLASLRQQRDVLLARNATASAIERQHKLRKHNRMFIFIYSFYLTDLFIIYNSYLLKFSLLFFSLFS